MAPRLQTNYTVTYSSGTYTITYADTYATVTFLGSDIVLLDHPSNTSYFYVGALDFLTLLDFSKCTSPSGASRAIVTAAITALGASLSLPVSVANGGTGATSLTGVLKGNGTSAITASSTLAVADGGTGASTLTGVLKGNGTGAITASSTLAVADGGTGASTLTGVLKGNGTSAITASSTLAVADGGTGASTLTGVLKGNGTGAITASSTLAVADGGTGASSLTGVLIGNGTSAVTDETWTQGTTHTSTWTGAVTTGSLTHKLNVIGNVVYFTLPDFGDLTAGATAQWDMTTALSSAFRPISTKTMPILIRNNTGQLGRLTVNTDGTAAVNLAAGGTFTSGATVRVFGQTVTWTLDV